MAFGFSRKVSGDVSSGAGALHRKAFQGFPGEAMPIQKKLREDPRRTTGRPLFETIILGIFAVMVALVPLIMTRVPAPESVIRVKEVLADWCTPSICFVFLIVGVMVTTSGVLWGAQEGTIQDPNTFSNSYLIQRPVSASQLDPLRMPGIFFSVDSARANANAATAAIPVCVAQPIPVTVPVYYPALVTPRALPLPHKRDDDEGRLEPADKGRFEPADKGRFEAADESSVEPEEEGRYESEDEGRFEPDEEGRYESEEEGRFEPQDEGGFEREDEGRFDREDEARFEPEDEGTYESEEEESFEPEVHPLPVESLPPRAMPLPYAQVVPNVIEPALEVLQSPPPQRLTRSLSNSSNSSAVQEPQTPPAPPSPRVQLRHSGRKPPTAPPPLIVRESPRPAPPSVIVRESPRPAPPPVIVRESPRPVPTVSEAVVSPATLGEAANVIHKLERVATGEHKESSERKPPSHPSSRITPEFTTPTPVVAPSLKVLSPPVTPPKREAVTSDARKLTTERLHSAPGIRIGTPILGRQLSVPTRRPREVREVRVADDDKADDKDQKQDSLSDDDVDQRVEAFLRNFREQMRLQRQESLQRYRRGEEEP